MLIFRFLYFVLLASLLLCGCASRRDSDFSSEEMAEYHGIYKRKSELSDDTVRWLEWYHTLPPEQQELLSFVPSEFSSEDFPAQAAETASAPAYYASLTIDEINETEKIANSYFKEFFSESGCIAEISPAADDSPLYQNKGIENEYDPGNIIIYYALCSESQENTGHARSISIARRSKSDRWKVINFENPALSYVEDLWAVQSEK